MIGLGSDKNAFNFLEHSFADMQGVQKKQFSSQLAVEGHIPSNPGSQNSNSESSLFWDTLYAFPESER